MAKTLTACILILLVAFGPACAALTSQAHWSNRIIFEARTEMVQKVWADEPFVMSQDNGFEKYTERLTKHMTENCGVLMGVGDMALPALFLGANPDDLYGVTGFLPEPFVLISNKLKPKGHFEALTHEAGHVFQPLGLKTYAEHEVFAELVSYRLLDGVGAITDERRNIIRYLSSYGTGLTAIQNGYLSDVDRVSHALLFVLLTTEQIDPAKCAPVDKLY